MRFNSLSSCKNYAAEFVVEVAGEEYDVPEIKPNRKSRLKSFLDKEIRNEFLPRKKRKSARR